MFQICSVASIVSSDPFFLSLKQSKRVTSLCITDASSINASSPELAANLRQSASYVAWISPKYTIQLARDGKGEIESVRYSAINAMLLNEFLKEHRMVQTQGATLPVCKSKSKRLLRPYRKSAHRLN
jgi:hypothetical protein